jgi:hypothetical protein
VTDTLVFQDRVSMPLWDYGWFDVTTFTMPAVADSWDIPSVIAALLLHPAYGVSYMVPLAQDEPGQACHGPFQRTKIQPRHFQALAADALAEHMALVLHDPDFFEPPSPAQRAAVQAQIAALLTPTSQVFHLALALTDADYLNDWPLVHDVFTEYLIIDPTRQTLAICVIGYD